MKTFKLTGEQDYIFRCDNEVLYLGKRREIIYYIVLEWFKKKAEQHLALNILVYKCIKIIKTYGLTTEQD